MPESRAPWGWLAEKPDFGRVAAVAGEVVGFVGAIHADRLIEGQVERMVDICAWYLDREHRGAGAGKRLMAEATADPARHYLINTSSSRTVGILAELGFRVLDDHRYDWRRRSAGSDEVSVELGREAILRRVDAGQRRVLADHAGLPVTPALFAAPEGIRLAVFSVTRKHDWPWLDVLHVSDPDLLARHGQAVADLMLPAGDAVMSADARFCSSEPQGAERVALPVPRFVKSATLGGHHVDHLYTELQLLDLKLD